MPVYRNGIIKRDAEYDKGDDVYDMYTKNSHHEFKLALFPVESNKTYVAQSTWMSNSPLGLDVDNSTGSATFHWSNA